MTPDVILPYLWKGLDYLLVPLLTLSAGAVSTWWVLVSDFGKRLIAQPFERRLKEFEYDNNAKLERLRSHLKHLDDRGVRANEKEHAALEEIWAAFGTAWDAVDHCVTLQVNAADLDTMPKDSMVRWLVASHLTVEEANEIASKPRPFSEYSAFIRTPKIEETEQKLRDLKRVLDSKSVYIQAELATQFRELAFIMGMVMFEQRRGIRVTDGSGAGFNQSMSLRDTGTHRFSAIEAAVRERIGVRA